MQTQLREAKKKRNSTCIQLEATSNITTLPGLDARTQVTQPSAKIWEQSQYMGNCSPTSPLTREHSTDNKLGQGRGRRAGAQILILTKKMSDLPDISPISSIIQDGERGTVRDRVLPQNTTK